MERSIDAHVDANPEKVRAILSDLANYPHWLELVSEATPAAPTTADTGPAWLVTLKAEVGRFARSKQLRMVRTTAADSPTVVFERAEVDDREHSPWTLRATIDPDAAGSRVNVQLHYGGRLWTAPLEAVLGKQVEAALPKLQALANDT